MTPPPMTLDTGGWVLSHRGDPDAVAIADRHYNRQHVGSPQFVPPGRCIVLKTDTAVWVTSWPFAEYVKHAWAGAWVNSIFRKEGDGIASEMIRSAIACTRHFWEPPELGIITFIDQRKVKPTIRRGVPTWGYSYIKAGFHYAGLSKGGLLCFQLLPDDMPAAIIPVAAQGRLAL